MRTFGEILKAQRQKLNLTQKQVAESIGMSDAYICSLESDKKSPPPYYTVSAIAQVLQLDTDQLWKIAIKHREKQAIERIRRGTFARKKVIGRKSEDEISVDIDFVDVPDNQVNAFFARPEVQMTTIGLFHRQPEEMTMDEKKFVFQAMNKVQEFIGRSDKLIDSSEDTE